MVTTSKPKNHRYKDLIEQMYSRCDLLVGYTEFLGGGGGGTGCPKKSVTPNPKQEVFFTKTVCQGIELITRYFEHLANIFFYKSCGRDLIHNFYAKNHFNNYLKRGLHI